MTQTLQNDVVPRRGQIQSQRVQEAAVYNFLSQKGHCSTGRSTSEAWRKLFFKQFLSYVPSLCLWGPAQSRCTLQQAQQEPMELWIPWTVACRYKVSRIQNTQSGAFSTTQIPRHVRVSWHATSCTASHTQLWSVRPRKLTGLSAPEGKQRAGCWSLCTLYNHLLSQQANLFCQWWDWITF